MALLVCQLLPADHYIHQKIRRRLTFEVLQLQLPNILSSRSAQSYLLQQAQLPQEWLNASKALYAQHYGFFESAIEYWLQGGGDLGNATAAHNLFYKHILPLYATKNPAKISLTKALYFDKVNRQAAVNNQQICVVDEQLNNMLAEFDLRMNAIENYNVQTMVFTLFVRVLKDLSEAKADPKLHLVQRVQDIRGMIK